MKATYKLVSMFLILVLLVNVTSAATAAETKQDSRLKTLEKSVSKILTRLTAIENKLLKVQTPPYSGVFGKFEESPQRQSNNIVSTMTINIPVASNVYLSASGFIDKGAEPYLQVDDVNMVPDWAYYFPNAGPFTISRIVKLNAGTHSIYLHVSGGDGQQLGPVFDLTMSAVASESGAIYCGYGNDASQSNCMLS